MIILGIDPAIRTSGYGVIECTEKGEIKVLDCGVIVNKPKMRHTECLRRIAGGVSELLNTYKIDCAAIEEPFVGKNSKTAIILGMARGAFLAKLAENGIPVYSYSARLAKKAAVGNGSAEKEQVALMMAAQLGIEVENILLDATDALAIAMCHAQRALHYEIGDLLASEI